MSYSSSRATLERLLAPADVRLSGERPWDICVHDERAYARILRDHNLGLGEAYMDGWIECARWDECAAQILKADLLAHATPSLRVGAYALHGTLRNLGAKSRAFQIGKAHYDIGNDLYERMLDRRMAYSCGYWKNARNLDEAQEAKLDLICRKVRLEPGMRILDIGCGWGSFSHFAAERYGVQIVGLTVSKQQAILARERCQGLPVEILLQDYRDTRGSFDRIISIGMFEHVAYKNYRTFMQLTARVLKDDGLFLLHTIGGNASVHSTDAWIQKYIFPNSMLPSIAQIGRAAERLFVIEDWHNFGADYDTTLMAWHDNFERHWPELSVAYSARFYRMWRYYLLTCAGSFRARQNQLWQIVFSKRGVPGGYESVR